MNSVPYITLTGLSHYYGTTPFAVGRTVALIKDPQNKYDAEAVKAALPYIGTIGYVANSTNTVILGTYSAGRIYDTIKEITFARVAFILPNAVICHLEPDSVPEETPFAFTSSEKASQPEPSGLNEMDHIKIKRFLKMLDNDIQNNKE